MTHSAKEIRQKQAGGGTWTKFENKEGGEQCQWGLSEFGRLETLKTMVSVHVRKGFLDMLKRQMPNVAKQPV